MAGEQKKVGVIECFCCGEECDVRQIKGRGDKLYLSCKNCSGAMRFDRPMAQKRIWENMRQTAGYAIKKPSCIPKDSESDGAVVLVVEREDSESPEKLQGAGDFNPNTLPEPEPEPEPEQEPEKGSKKGLLALGVVVLGAVAGGFLS